MRPFRPSVPQNDPESLILPSKSVETFTFGPLFKAYVEADSGFGPRHLPVE